MGFKSTWAGTEVLLYFGAVREDKAHFGWGKGELVVCSPLGWVGFSLNC